MKTSNLIIKCPNDKVTVLLAGQYQNGKSTLINCLLGGKYAIEGGMVQNSTSGVHTTACRTLYIYSERACYYKVTPFGKCEVSREGLMQAVNRNGEDFYLEAEISSPLLKEINLVDAPGWGVEDWDDNQAEVSLQGADYVIYVAQKQLMQGDKNFLRLIKDKRKYFCAILNVLDAVDPGDTTKEDIVANCNAIIGVFKQIGMDAQFIGFPSESGLAVINLLWAKYALHLLDNPESKYDADMAARVCAALDYELPKGEIEYEELLENSGYKDWKMFFEHSLRMVEKFDDPVETDIHKEISLSICENLIKVLRRS